MNKTHKTIFDLLFFSAVLMTSASCTQNRPSHVSEASQESTFLTLAEKRFSVRQYADQPVEQEKLDAILKAASLAPTAANKQPHRIYVLQSPEALAKVDSLTRCRYGAPVVLLFTYDTSEDWKNQQEEGVHSGIEDVSIVATHCMMEATELGLGSVWVNVFPNSQMEKTFGIPQREKSVLIMPIGYKAEGAEPSPMHNSRKPISDIVKYL